MPVDSFVHPVHRTPLVRAEGGYRCERTGDTFPDQRGVACFLPPAQRQQEEQERTDFTNRVKTLLRRSPRLYMWLIYLISPVCYVGLTAPKFLRRFATGSLVLNVGSGVHRYAVPTVNLDVFPYKEVDVVGDALAMPFQDNTFDGALCECLLEHVTDPKAVVREMVRVLKPGGEAFITVPFVYGYHGCPNDFYRWTVSGMRELCDAGEIVEIRSRSGPTSGLVSSLVTWLAITLSFGSQRLYEVWSMVLLIPLAPLKFFDHIVGRFPTAVYGTEGFYAIIRKPRV